MSTFWNNKELEQMHIELTNACNAACPMCVRFYKNSPNLRPDLELGQITLEKFKTYFPPDVIQACKLILFCGVHGDPGIAKDLFEICEYIQQSSPLTEVRLNTNGGMRKPEWWSKLGTLFAKRKLSNNDTSNWRITFSIDGLEDTNHLYRRNVDWKSLMENVTAFIDAGGIADWDFLIFKHNEHQILEAQELSKKMKFADFIPKKALGVSNEGENKLHIMPVLNKSGELEYTIEAPLDPNNRILREPRGVEPLTYYPFTKQSYKEAKENPNLKKEYTELVDDVYESRIKNGNFDDVNACGITCKARTPNDGIEIFVDNFGRVMPCCYVGTHLNGVYTDTASLQLHKHMNDYGWDNFSLEKHTLREILDAGHLDRVFADSWLKDSVANGKLIYCANVCGKKSGISQIFSHDLNNKEEIRKQNRLNRIQLVNKWTPTVKSDD